MRYVFVGTTSSEAEFQQVLASCRRRESRRRRIEELVEFLNMVTKCEELGLAATIHKWRRTAADPAVLLYYRDDQRDDTGIWAAVTAAPGTVTLLKIVGTFGGGEQEREGLLADALHRKARGTVIEGGMP